MKKILLTVGMPGSGKEEFVKIARKLGIPVVRMGDIVREYVKSKRLNLTDEIVGEIANTERLKYGYGIWAIRALPKITENFTVVDGCRSIEELNIFKKNFRVMIVGIFASPKTRYERLKRRARPDAPKTFEMFCERDLREIKWGIGDVFVLADYVVVNESTLRRFRKNAESIVTTFLRSHTST
jgi:dephospho-CoA kinase